MFFLLHQLRSSGIRSQRLGTLVLEGSPYAFFWLSALGKAGHGTGVERKPLDHIDNVMKQEKAWGAFISP